MKFIADLHIHSKYSRATAKNLDLENIYIAAQLKGITVVGTGDFTHPQWFSEIKEKLVPAEPGLYQLREDISKYCDQEIPDACKGKVRFVLVTEISNIYKKDQKTRKNHNLIFMPDIESSEKFNRVLNKIGNIKSDGRPILGLDARDLLEIMLENNPDGFLVPAHIWTPWFSVLGSKSGFDSIQDCFEDLTDHIFAVETGLSSDPAMNRRVSKLDGLTLISNSDAHSPSKLGREANLFDADLSYHAIKSAIQRGDPDKFLGTLEFYPEEGKYHMDGHRKCRVCLNPEKTKKNNGICPVCGKALTLGVLYRVEELADRKEGHQPPVHHPFYHIIPLSEILSEIFQVGSGTKKVSHHYNMLLEKFGPELNILHSLDIDIIKKTSLSLLGEAIDRMRKKNVSLSPGYDGEFGRIKVFDSEEREKFKKQKKLFEKNFNDIHQTKTSDSVIFKKAGKKIPEHHKNKVITTILPDSNLKNPPDLIIHGLNREQRKAVEHQNNPLMINAGPGTGKTLTLTQRIVHLILKENVLPNRILAVTFTNKAAQEMRQRVEKILGQTKNPPLTATFHSLCLKILTDNNQIPDFSIIDDDEQKYLLNLALRMTGYENQNFTIKPGKIFKRILLAKQQVIHPDDLNHMGALGRASDVIRDIYRRYQKLLSIQKALDYEDLIIRTIQLFETNQTVLKKYQNQYQNILIDEYQDLNQGQYRLIRLLSPHGKNLFVIGDPNQSIYGFRGSEVQFFKRFIKDFPDSKTIRLRHNYRSTQTILDAGFQIIINDKLTKPDQTKIYSDIHGIQTIGIIETASEKAEAVAVGKHIENLIGGMGFYSIDFGKTSSMDGKESYGFSDFAVLFRTRRQSEIIYNVLGEAGIPCQVVGKNNDLYRKGLNPLIALIKVVRGSGSYSDLEKLIKQGGTGIGKKTFDGFVTWGIQNEFSLSKAMSRIDRVPIKNIQKEKQRKLCELAERIISMEKEIVQLDLDKQIAYILNRSGDLLNLYEKTISEKIRKKLLHMLDQYGAVHNRPFSRIALHSDPDEYDSKTEKVSLMTMHTSKGLEFPVVFIAGCEKGLIPYQRSESETKDPDEERRLFYVAITRAKERLFLSYTKKRRIYGNVENREPSPFIDDMENRLKKKVMQKKVKIAKNKGPVQMKLF